MTANTLRVRAAALCLLYLAFAGAVAAGEYSSERAKLSRGVFSDTSPPTLFLQIATVPTSLILQDRATAYPAPGSFDPEANGERLVARVRFFLAIAVAQAVLVLLVLLRASRWQVRRLPES